ncbi:MAG: DNA repair protein RecO [Betaproteobacteria bacterium]|nr:DNA repair protein RecO [Betaproteobacteria bacterium]
MEPARPSHARAREAQVAAGYVLHSYPFRETSLIVEFFTRSHGRVGLMAKGARRPKSSLRGTLMAFQPMRLTWSGKAELKTLHGVDWEAGHLQLQGLQLMCGFYVNELLLKLVPREDPHEGLYAAYEQAIHALRDGAAPARLLRRFERELLREMGYELLLERDVDGQPVQPGAEYVYQIERGPVPLSHNGAAPGLRVRGKTLLDLAMDMREGDEDSLTDQEGRTLMRQAIGHYLNGQELRTRQLLRELQDHD